MQNKKANHLEHFGPRCISLFDMIQKGTDLNPAIDYIHLPVKRPQKNIPDPENWVLLSFKKTELLEREAKKDIVNSFLSEGNLETQEPSNEWKKVYQIYVNISNNLEFKVMDDTDIKEKEEQNLNSTENLTEKSKAYIKIIEEVHRRNCILGTLNVDQRDLENGFVNFNYKDEKEMQMTIKILTKLNIEFRIRCEVACNLSIKVNPDQKIEKIPQKKNRHFTRKEIIAIVIWYLKKTHRLKFVVTPEIRKGEDFGISTLGTVLVKKAVLNDIMTEIKRKFDICLILQTNNSEKTDFFILTNKLATEICENYAGNLTAKILIEKIEEYKKTNNINSEKQLKTEDMKRVKNVNIQKLQEIAKANDIPWRGHHDHVKGSMVVEAQKQKKENEYMVIVSQVKTEDNMMAMENFFNDLTKIEGATTTQRGKQSMLINFLASSEFIPKEQPAVEKIVEQSASNSTEKEKPAKRRYIRKNHEHLHTEELIMNNDPEEELRKMLNDPDLQGTETLVEIQTYFDEKEKEARVNEKIAKAKELLALLKK